MLSNMDKFIVEGGNRSAFEAIRDITKEGDGRACFFLYGPSGSGKTTLLQARCRDKNLLSSERVKYCHVEELVSFFNLADLGDAVLEEIGTTDILLLDGLEYAQHPDSLESKLCCLLLKARNQERLLTIAASNLPREEFQRTELGEVLACYEPLVIEKLDEHGLAMMIQMIEKEIAEKQRCAHLSPDAVKRISQWSVGDPEKASNAARYLLTAAGLASDKEVSAEDVSRLLKEAH